MASGAYSVDHGSDALSISSDDCSKSTLSISSDDCSKSTLPISSDECSKSTLSISSDDCGKSTLPIMLCKQHKTMELSQYCESDKEVLCAKCKIISHRNCKTTEVSSCAIQMKKGTNFNETKKYLVDLNTSYDNLKEKRMGDRDEVKTQIQNSIKYIRLKREKINKTFDKLEKDLRDELADIERSITTEIENHMTIVDDALSEIQAGINSMTNCHESGDVNAMFISMTKACATRRNYERTLTNVRHEMYLFSIQFKANDVLTDILKELQSIGTVAIEKEPLFQTQELDVGSHFVNGCSFINDGYILLGCGYDGLKLLDKDLNIRSHLPDFSLQVAATSDKDVIVTQGDKKQIMKVKVLPKLVVEKTIKLDRICTGVDVYGDEIYVTCHDNPGNGEVRVLDMDGVKKRQLGVTRWFGGTSYMFKNPNCVKVSKDGKKIFVADELTGVLTCLSEQGTPIFEYKDEVNLKIPTGIHLNIDGTLLVCGHESNNIHKIRSDGVKEGILLSNKNGIHNPVCIAYSPDSGILAVGLGAIDFMGNTLLLITGSI